MVRTARLAGLVVAAEARLYCEGEQVEIQAGERLVEIYFQQRRIASHVRQYHSCTTTESAHLQEKHAKHQRWTRGRLMN